MMINIVYCIDYQSIAIDNNRSCWKEEHLIPPKRYLHFFLYFLIDVFIIQYLFR
jgi:hypothetical protein